MRKEYDLTPQSQIMNYIVQVHENQSEEMLSFDGVDNIQAKCCIWRKLKMAIFGGDNEKIMVIIVYGSMHFQMNLLEYFAINFHRSLSIGTRCAHYHRYLYI